MGYSLTAYFVLVFLLTQFYRKQIKIKMRWNPRKLLPKSKIGWWWNKSYIPNIAINILKNVRMFGQRAADTEGYVFGIQFELFVHHHHEINQILGRHEAIAEIGRASCRERVLVQV